LEAVKVLIVEDERDLTEAIAELIEDSFEKVSITIAFDGEEGLNASRSEKFDIILSDHRMPKMTGAQFITSTKEDPANPNQKTPVLFLSGYILEIKNNIQKYENVIYLEKPYREESLLRNIRMLIAK
jgi:CheY-like chemotaxis protein